MSWKEHPFVWIWIDRSRKVSKVELWEIQNWNKKLVTNLNEKLKTCSSICADTCALLLFVFDTDMQQNRMILFLVDIICLYEHFVGVTSSLSWWKHLCSLAPLSCENPYAYVCCKLSISNYRNYWLRRHIWCWNESKQRKGKRTHLLNVLNTYSEHPLKSL